MRESKRFLLRSDLRPFSYKRYDHEIDHLLATQKKKMNISQPVGWWLVEADANHCLSAC